MNLDIGFDNCFPPEEFMGKEGWHILRTDRGEETVAWKLDEDEIDYHHCKRWWKIGYWMRDGQHIAATSDRAGAWTYLRPVEDAKDLPMLDDKYTVQFCRAMLGKLLGRGEAKGHESQ